MVKLASLNSRMKDFHDIVHLSRQGSFRLEDLVQAVVKTFDARGTLVPTDIASWQDEYISSHATMWRSYLARVGESDGTDLSVMARELREFLAPVLAAIRNNRSNDATWSPASRSWED